MGEIDAAELRAGNTRVATDTRALRVQIARLPRDQQVQITQQAQTLFQTRIVPLREQWRQRLVQKQQDDRARDAERRKEMTADAATAGSLQAERALLGERQQRGEVSGAEFTRADQAAERDILALQQKYADYGANWGRAFAQAVAVAARTATANLRVEQRLNDTESEIGRDAHRAAELTLTVQRNQVFRTQGALTAAEERSLNATAQAVAATIAAKYPSGAAAADFKDRVTRLVRAGAAEQRPQWERDAQEAVRVAAVNRAAETAATAPSAAAAARSVPLPAVPAAVPNPRPSPVAAAPQPAAVAGSAGAAAPLLPPPALAEPVVATSVLVDSGSSWMPLFLLLLVGGGAGAGWYVTVRRRREQALPTFSNAGNQYRTAPPTARPQPPVTPATATVSSPPRAVAVSAERGVKAQLFGAQRQKYQARYADAMDDVTAASRVVADMEPVVAAVRENLELLSKSVQARVSRLLARSAGNPRTLLMHAAALMPVWALIKRIGLIPRIVLGIALWWTLQSIVSLIDEGGIGVVIILYAIVVAIFFFVERHRQLQVPRRALRAATAQFKNARLAYVYSGQRPGVERGASVYQAVRVAVEEKADGGREITVPASPNASVSPGSYLLTFGRLATFRVDKNGSATRLEASNDEFMSRHGGLVSEALGEQQAFANATFPPFAEYGQAVWRRRQAQSEIPRLEALLRDVDRIEDIWRETYVADDVFEFLFRSIDMFNMRDPATPPGLLLYGSRGNGKEHLVRKIAETISARLHEVTPGDVYDHGAIESLWASNRGLDPVVLYIANADTLFARSSDGLPSRQALEWIGEWKKHEPRHSRVWVVMTARSDRSIDEAILDHVGQDSKIEIKEPDAKGRRLIFQLACRHYGVSAPPSDAVLKDIGRTTVDSIRKIVAAAKRTASPNQPQASHWLGAATSLLEGGSDPVPKEARWNTLILSERTLTELHKLSDALQHLETFQLQGVDPPRGAVLWGPPGTGKTQIAKTLANESGVRCLLRGPSDLGRTAESVRTLFNEARSKAPCILFIDEFEAVGKARTEGGRVEVVTELLSQMQGARKEAPVFVLGATNYLETLDEALLSRFTYQIEVPNPGLEQREQLFGLFLGRTPHGDIDVAAVSAELARKGGGLAGRDINDVVVRASQSAAQRALRAGTPDKVTLTREDLLEEVADMVKSRSTAVDPTATWDTLVVSDKTMQELKQLGAALRNMEDRLKQGVKPPRGAILYGPPGTGKTQIAKTLANESGVQYEFKKASDLVGRYVGESIQKVEKLFANARKKAPCIVFVDEFEAVASKRGGNKGSEFKDEVVPQLLAEVDGAIDTGRAVFLLAATNYLEYIDEAVLDRFDHIEVPNPTPEQRVRLFTVFLKKVPRVDFDIDEVAADLARRCGEIGGRKIHDAVQKAQREAAARAEEAGDGDRIVLTRDDLLRQFAPKGRPVSEEDLTAVWSQIVLAPDVKENILSMIRLFNQGSRAAPKGLLLWGPPGTGKTEIARLLARSTGCEFLETGIQRLKGRGVGESVDNVKALWEKARTMGRAVIFVDECDGVFARRGGINSDGAVEEINNAFLPAWDGLDSKGQIWVVGATNMRDRLDEGILSRFGEMIEIGLPGPSERIEILGLELRKFESDIVVPEFVGKATSGFSGRNLSKVAAALFRLAPQGNRQVTDDTWRQLIRQFGTAGGDAVDADAGWDSLILQAPVIKRLQRISQMLGHAETLREQGLKPPEALLLYGPPGTGKTQIARTLANESGLNFIAAGPSDIKGVHLGDSGKLVHELFDRARSKPTVLFIDEIDAGAPSRTGPNADKYTDEIVINLLNEMDGVKKKTGTVFVLAAANHPDRIDDALLSRFKEKLEIPNPGPDERRRMLKVFIGRRRVDFDVDAVAEELAPLLEGMSGRALVGLVDLASQRSAERAFDAGTPGEIVLTREDLVSSLS